MSRDQCQARLWSKFNGGRCNFAAKHTHTGQDGTQWKLCNIHLRTIKRRERLGSDEELATRWRAS